MTPQTLRVLRWSLVRRADFRLPEDVYEHWVVLAAEEGTFRYEVAGHEAGAAKPGDLVFCPPGAVLRRAGRTPSLTFLFVEFRPGDGEELMPTPGRRGVAERRRLASTFAGFRALSRAGADAARWVPHLTRDLLYLAAGPEAGATAPPEPADPVMHEAGRRLRASVAAPFALEELARDLGLSPSQLTRRFAAAFGVPPAEYRAGLRLESARTLLLETDWTLDRIAAACGYRDGLYLSRVFRRRMGVAPSAYRNGNRV